MPSYLHNICEKLYNSGRWSAQHNDTGSINGQHFVHLLNKHVYAIFIQCTKIGEKQCIIQWLTGFEKNAENLENGQISASLLVWMINGSSL